MAPTVRINRSRINQCRLFAEDKAALPGPIDEMWARLEPWQIAQLQRLGNLDPERAESILNTLWNSFPRLFEEVAISAVDQEMLSVEECARKLSIAEFEVEEKLLAFRKAAYTMERAVVLEGDKKVARLNEGHIPVWEVVREFRKLGSVARLKEAFPGIPVGELAAALRYAEAHMEEIERQIDEYETVRAMRRSQYPFSK